MAVSKRLRYEILRRDQHTCRYCGATAPDVPLRIDHVTPVALGGTDTPDNLVTACQDCNSGKSSASPDAHHVDNVSQDALRWADAMKQAADNLRKQETPKLEYRDAFLAEWNRWHVGKGEAKEVPLPNDWKPAMDRFRVAGVPTWMWGDIVDIGMTNEKVKPENTFRYCCGIAWNKVTALQAEARRIVAPDAPQPELSPLPEALAAAALEVWRYETCEALTDAQEAELRAGVVEAVKDSIGADEIIRAAKHAAWIGYSSIPEGLADIAAEARHMGTLNIWESAWAASSGARPSTDEFKAFTESCSALARSGASTEQIHLAAAFAGSHLTPHLYLGLDVDHLESANVKWARQRAVDFWAASSAATSHRWPSVEEREAVNRSIDRIQGDGGFRVHDLWAAAAAAGAYEDTDLSTAITRNLSVFEIAAQPMAGA
ncbi:HNH endonuclease [Streptomyces natalensis]|uniref:HNH endonuclease n=1 Tax=Streptomyces natalensis TaxID=68242 RepID=UPI00056A85A2|nr:HNH endonuclease [Streptomyces natalensis]